MSDQLLEEEGLLSARLYLLTRLPFFWRGYLSFPSRLPLPCFHPRFLILSRFLLVSLPPRSITPGSSRATHFFFTPLGICCLQSVADLPPSQFLIPSSGDFFFFHACGFRFDCRIPFFAEVPWSAPVRFTYMGALFFLSAALNVTSGPLFPLRQASFSSDLALFFFPRFNKPFCRFPLHLAVFPWCRTVTPPSQVSSLLIGKPFFFF